MSKKAFLELSKHENIRHATIAFGENDSLYAYVEAISVLHFFGDRFGTMAFITKESGRVHYHANEISGYTFITDKGKKRTFITHDNKFYELIKTKSTHELYLTKRVDYSIASDHKDHTTDIYAIKNLNTGQFTILEPFGFKLKSYRYFPSCQKLAFEIRMDHLKYSDMFKIFDQFSSCLP